ERAQAAVDELQRDGVGAIAVPGDVRDVDAVAAMVEGVVTGLGGIDVAVNNVGNLGGEDVRAFTDIDERHLRAVIDQHLIAPTLCCVAEARTMIAAGRGGVILNVTSRSEEHTS